MLDLNHLREEYNLGELPDGAILAWLDDNHESTSGLDTLERRYIGCSDMEWELAWDYLKDYAAYFDPDSLSGTPVNIDWQATIRDLLANGELDILRHEGSYYGFLIGPDI